VKFFPFIYPKPTYEKLDRVLKDTDWEKKLLVSVRVLARLSNLSDHAPILLTTGTPTPQRPRQFKFELGWLLRDGFHEMVTKIWEKPVARSTPSKGGITNSVLCGDTLVDGRDA
jgi:hypothetical protein